MDSLLLCRLHDVLACVVTFMDPILLCYLHYAKDPILFFYLHEAFLFVVLCFCMWLYLRSTYKDKYAREYAELIMWNKIRDRQVREYQDRETRMKKNHDDHVESVTKTYFHSELNATVRLRGIIKSLKSERDNLCRELNDLRGENADALIRWLRQYRHLKANDWVPELLPTSQADSP